MKMFGFSETPKAPAAAAAPKAPTPAAAPKAPAPKAPAPKAPAAAPKAPATAMVSQQEFQTFKASVTGDLNEILKALSK